MTGYPLTTTQSLHWRIKEAADIAALAGDHSKAAGLFLALEMLEELDPDASYGSSDFPTHTETGGLICYGPEGES